MNKGIFISDEARTSLNIFVSEDEFNELKKRLDQPITGTQKCYLTGKVCNHDEGLFVPSDNMADAIERNLQAAESVWKEFKNNIIICECGKKFKFETNDVLCPYCKKHINVKKYRKKIKLPETKRIAFKLYISHLRRKKC